MNTADVFRRLSRAVKFSAVSILILAVTSSGFAAQTGPSSEAGSRQLPTTRISDRIRVDGDVEYIEFVPDRSVFSLDYVKAPDRPRSIFWSPLLTFVLPGVDQLIESQIPQAGLYAGTAVTGLGITILAARQSLRVSGSTRNDYDDLATLGSQVFMAAGSFSAYSSFRSAARTHQPEGRFTFLTKEERVDDLLKAPFDFSLLEKRNTWIPLLIALGLGVVDVTSNREPLSHNSYNIQNAAFGTSFSYLAGTNEEALFRGWLMPVLQDRFDSNFWSNTATAGIFAAAHLGSVRVPIAQFLLGWHLGHVAQKNEWTLRESIFIHTWWDIILFTADYLEKSKNDPAHAVIRTPVINASF